MKHNIPLVSVVLPVYNGARFLRDTIDSIINQSYKNMEIIIVDDASTDESREIIDSYQDERIIKIYKDKNENICCASNLAFERMNGKYCALIGHDDIWYTDKIEKQVNFMEVNLEYGICFTRCNILNQDNRIIDEEHGFNHVFNDYENKEREAHIYQLYMFGNRLCAPSALIRTEDLKKVGSYDYSLVQMQDYYLWLKLLTVSKLHILEEKLLGYRQILDARTNLSTVNRKTELRTAREFVYIRENYLYYISNELYKDVFFSELMRKEVSCEEDFLCEKMFLLKKMNNPSWIRKCSELLNDKYCRIVLDEKYNYTVQDYYRDNQESNLPLVSIIMPVYNAEEFIERTILNLNEQTYDNIEVIVINDGSKDNTRVVLDKLSQRKDLYIKLRVIHQANMGICHTRNNGLDVANGKYIAFMNHDDFMLPNAIELLVKKAEVENADMVIGGYELVDVEKNVLEQHLLDIFDPWSIFKINAPWGRIFRNDIIQDNEIKFYVTRVNEAFYFNYCYMSCCDKIEVISQVTYQRLFGKSLETHANMSRYSEDRDLFEMLTALMNDMRRENSLPKEYVEYAMMEQVFLYMYYVAPSLSKEDIESLYTRAISWLNTHYPNYKRNRLVRFAKQSHEGLQPSVYVKTMVVLERMHLLKFFLYLYVGRSLRKR